MHSKSTFTFELTDLKQSIENINITLNNSRDVSATHRFASLSAIFGIASALASSVVDPFALASGIFSLFATIGDNKNDNNVADNINKIWQEIDSMQKDIENICEELKDIRNEIKCNTLTTNIDSNLVEQLKYILTRFKSYLEAKNNNASDLISEYVRELKNYCPPNLGFLYHKMTKIITNDNTLAYVKYCGNSASSPKEKLQSWIKLIDDLVQLFQIASISCEHIHNYKTSYSNNRFIKESKNFIIQTIKYYVENKIPTDAVDDPHFRNNLVNIFKSNIYQAGNAVNELKKKYPYFDWGVIMYDRRTDVRPSSRVYYSNMLSQNKLCSSLDNIDDVNGSGMDVVVWWCNAIISNNNDIQLESSNNHAQQTVERIISKNNNDLNFALCTIDKRVERAGPHKHEQNGKLQMFASKMINITVPTEPMPAQALSNINSPVIDSVYNNTIIGMHKFRQVGIKLIKSFKFIEAVNSEDECWKQCQNEAFCITTNFDTILKKCFLFKNSYDAIELPSYNLKYVGCFQDSVNPRDLNDANMTYVDMTAEMCNAYCSQLEFKYFGLQNSSQCFCGNSYGKFGLSNNCQMSCSGNAQQKCGGNYVNSVYESRCLF